jgi:hypothetical protein
VQTNLVVLDNIYSDVNRVHRSHHVVTSFETLILYKDLPHVICTFIRSRHQPMIPSRFITLIHKISFLIAAITGLLASILSFIWMPTIPPWILILIMISAWSFFVTFATVAMFKPCVPPSRNLMLALFLFSAGAYGIFLISLQLYSSYFLRHAYYTFLRDSVITASTLSVAALLLILELFVFPPPPTIKVVFVTIILSVAGLLTSAILAVRGNEWSSRLASIVAFALLLIGSICNLLS